MSESDPVHGNNLKIAGTKADNGKAPVMQGVMRYFPRAQEAVAFVSLDGANKYTWNGWETVPDAINRYDNALGRHILKESYEGMYDMDTGALHAAHVAWNAMARLELMLRENPLYKPEDN